MYLNGGAKVFLINKFKVQRFRLRLKGCGGQARFKVCRSALTANPFLKIQASAQKAQSSVLSPQHLFFLLPFLLFALCVMPLSAAYAASVDLEWDPNTEPELAGYKIYWGTASGNYTSSKDAGKTPTCTVTGLDEGKTYYFAATAYDGSSNESGYSNQISYKVPFSDSDGDGVPDDQDAFPSNPAETIDTDADGIGNNADTDDDNDQMPDTWEIQYGFDPLKDDASGDEDGDGRSNLDEYLAGTDPVVPQDNLEPDAPVLTAPANQQMVELTLELRTGAFFDPDSGDFHSATQWQIHRESDNVCVFDITSEYSLTQLQVPKLILDDNENYIWQARHFDNHGTPSQWSGIRSFITRIDPNDTNGDGIPDEQEVTTPSDLDGDGIWDSDQNTIKCVKTGEGKSLAISFKGSSTIVEIASVVAEYENGTSTYASTASSPDYFPFGLINFKLIMDQPGAQAEITIYFSEPAPQNGRWFKYDPIETTWTDFSTQTNFSQDRTAITLYLEDGGEGDADGLTNGIIVDPSGVGVASSSIGLGAVEDVVGSLSCFIATAASQRDLKQAGPVWNEIRGRELAIVLVLLALLKGMTIVLRRIKQRWEEIQRRYEMYHEGSARFKASDLFGPKKVKGVQRPGVQRSEVPALQARPRQAGVRKTAHRSSQMAGRL